MIIATEDLHSLSDNELIDKLYDNDKILVDGINELHVYIDKNLSKDTNAKHYEKILKLLVANKIAINDYLDDSADYKLRKITSFVHASLGTVLSNSCIVDSEFIKIYANIAEYYSVIILYLSEMKSRKII